MSYIQRRRFLWVLFLIGLVLIAIVSQATTLVRLPFGDLVHYSTAVARVRCMRTQTWLEKGEIWTDSSFQVIERDKGYLPQEIVVRSPGGKFLNLQSHVDGAPEFRSGEEVFLCLMGHPGKQYLIVGWTQGTFRIHRDIHNGIETVTQDSAEIPVFDPASNTFIRTGVKNLPVDIFQQRVRREAMRQTP